MHSRMKCDGYIFIFNSVVRLEFVAMFVLGIQANIDQETTQRKDLEYLVQQKQAEIEVQKYGARCRFVHTASKQIQREVSLKPLRFRLAVKPSRGTCNILSQSPTGNYWW